MDFFSVIIGGEFDARYQFNSGRSCEGHCFAHTLAGVMVGECKRRQTGAFCFSYQFCG